jgi:tRNA-2-methylthio-N6-dimethylallyladenosine synthase
MSEKKVYFETYGCQMNLNDTEIAGGILQDSGYEITEDINTADVILLNTCSVRDNAEQKILHRLEHLKGFKRRINKKLIVGIMGCMAERLGEKLIGLENLVRLVIGPDEYRSLPALLDQALSNSPGIAIELSTTETYSDIIPLRTEGLSAWLSIMRGCNNFCTYCIVPYTRGRERSKPIKSILEDLQRLDKSGIKEVTLLGQNVNSYFDKEAFVKFPELLEKAAQTVPNMRIRFVTSHPYDMSDELIAVMAKYDNICEYLHLPIQSGSDKILKLMNRKYTVEHYLERIAKLRSAMPDLALSTDLISGFPSETEEDHQATLELLKVVKYDGAYMFNYSPRSGTKSFEMEDDVDFETKRRRLSEIIHLQNDIARKKNKKEVGRVHEVLIDGVSKKKESEWQGRTKTNKVVIFNNEVGKYKQGDIINVRITKATSATLFGELSLTDV